MKNADSQDGNPHPHMMTETPSLPSQENAAHSGLANSKYSCDDVVVEHRHHNHERPDDMEPLNPYLPFRIGSGLPNYYGDYVRQIFFACGAAMLILSPFLASTFPAILPFEIGGGILFVILGALTNPSSQLSILADVIAAAVAVFAYEMLALSLYNNGSYGAFLERELLAIGFLVALYFAIKTLRNMMIGRVGKRDTISEFMRPGEASGFMNPGDGD